MRPSRVLSALVVLLAAVAVADAVRVRPRSFAGVGARAGRRRRIHPPHDGFGAKPRRMASTRDAVGVDGRVKDGARDAAYAERLRARREGEGRGEEVGTSRRRLTQTAARETDEAWTNATDVPEWTTCDGCRLTVRGLHADAVVAARTTPQSSWRALDETLREEVVALAWRETTCGRFKNVSAVIMDENKRLVDTRDGTRHSEVTNPAEARLRPEENADTFAASVLSNVCAFLRDDEQTRDLVVAALASIDDVRPMDDVGARDVCDKVVPNCTDVSRHDEL